jgi:hypothetical protein
MIILGILCIPLSFVIFTIDETKDVSVYPDIKELMKE